MPERRRINFTLSDDVVERLEEQVPHGNRSRFVENALEERLEE